MLLKVNHFLGLLILINLHQFTISIFSGFAWRHTQLASCLINAWPLLANEMGSNQSAVKSWHCRLYYFAFFVANNENKHLFFGEFYVR